MTTTVAILLGVVLLLVLGWFCFLIAEYRAMLRVEARRRGYRVWAANRRKHFAALEADHDDGDIDDVAPRIIPIEWQKFTEKPRRDR